MGSDEMTRNPREDSVTDLHNKTESCVQVSGRYVARFPVPRRVWQGCILSPSLFNISIDWLMDKLVKAAVGGTELNTIFASRFLMHP